MRRFITGLLLFVAASLPLSAKGTDWFSLTRQVSLESVVKVVDEYGHCTGVVVDENIVLTARHCVSDKPMFIEGHFAGVKQEVRDFILSDTCDLALLLVNTKGVGKKQIALATIEPSVGEHLAQFGYGHVMEGMENPLGNFREVVVSPVEYQDMLITTPNPRSGYSGGAVINSRGELVGITSAGSPQFHLGASERLPHVLYFLLDSIIHP